MMVISPDDEGRLAILLARNFNDTTTARRIVSDAGLRHVMEVVNFGDDARSVWWRVIGEVRDNRSDLKALLTIARDEHSGNVELADALARLDDRGAPTAVAPPITAAPRPRRPVPERSRLVDRTQNVSVIRDLLSAATGDHSGRRLLLTGDSGVGKTRLAEEAALIAGDLGMAVVIAQCVDQAAEPLLPLRDGLRQYRQTMPVRDLLAPASGAPMDYAPFLEAFLGSGDTSLGGSGPRDVYEGLAQVLLELAEPAGLCLVLEDLTDADQDTLAFLDLLSRKIARSRLVTVITVKEDLIDGRLEDRILKWRAADCQVSAVPPLSRADTAEFIAVLRGQPVDDLRAAEIYQLTGGNAFFVEQVAHLITEGGWRGGPVDVPDRIDAVLQRRLRRLTDEDRLFLEAAAVALDVTNRPEIVAHVAGTDPGTTAARLRAVVQRRLLNEDVEGTLGFPQALLQRVVRAGIPVHERTVMDVRAAEWLEGEELFASASHHYERAGRAADTVRTALAGAQQAERAGTWATAVALYLRIRPLADPIVVGVRLARDYLILGAWADAQEVLAGLPADLGEARVLRSELLFVRGAFDRALRELRLASQDPSVDRTDALIRLADIHLYLGRLRACIQLAREALAEATDPTSRARSFGAIGTSLYHLGDIAGAEDAYLAEMQALPEQVEERDRFAYTVTLHNLAIAREARQDWIGARRLHEEALRLRLEVSAAREVGHSRHSIVRCDIGLGEYDAARELLSTARAAAVVLGEGLEQCKLDHTEARIELLDAGDPHRAVHLLEGVRDRFTDMHVAYDIAHVGFTLGWAYQAVGLPRRATEELATARAGMDRGEFDFLTLIYPQTAYRYPDRIAAGLLAYAAGDAVGLPWEGLAAELIDPARLPSLHAAKDWAAGSTSDDTALTLLVSEYLAAEPHPDARGFLQRLAGAPELQGLGPSTTGAIAGFRNTGELPARGNTNGAVMRSLPIGWATPIDRALDRRAQVVELSRATHPGAEAITAACIGAACAAWALDGAPLPLLLEIAREEATAAVHERAADPRIRTMLAAIADSTWRPDPAADEMDPYETIARALWCVTTGRNLEDALLAAVRLGGDTDTVAAIVGGLLGCRLSPDDVRRQLTWLPQVHLPADEMISRLARGLADRRTKESDG